MSDYGPINSPPNSGDVKYGAFYLKWCRAVNKMFEPSPEKLDRTIARRKEIFKTSEARYKNAQREFRDIEYKFSKSHQIYKKAERNLRSMKRAHDKAERIYRQEKLNSALDLLGWDLSFDEIIAFAGFCAVLSLMAGFMVVIPIFILLDLTLLEAGLYIIPGLLTVPLVIYAFIASYPEILAKRVKTKSLGRSPEAINYLVMSMRLSPSISKAVAFAADSSDEPIASGLKKVLWNIYMREYDNVEESFLAFAYEWGEINEDFKRSLYAIRSSTLERSDEGRERVLEKASEIILEGTKRRIEDFTSSLHTPTTVLFALGILLPMIIGAMLPLMAMQVPTETSLRSTNIETTTGSSDGGGALSVILLMDVLFPLIAFVYAYHILGTRPGTSSPPDVKSRMSLSQKRKITATAIACFLMFSVAALPFFGLYNPILGPVPLLVGVGFALGYYCRATSKEQKKKRDEIKKMEDELPDALFKLGSRIAEGEPLETALMKVSESMRGSTISDLLERISYTIKVTRSTPREAMFGPELGVLRDLPSRTITATMKTVIACVEKDARTAGGIIINISNYQRDMKKVEHDIRTSLRETVEMMKSTGVLFAPLVMGITASLYVLLSREFAMLPGSTQMLSNEVFFLVIGIYLILMVMITVYFSVGIEHGEDRIELKHSIGNAVPVAVVVYAISLVAGQVLIG